MAADLAAQRVCVLALRSLRIGRLFVAVQLCEAMRLDLNRERLLYPIPQLSHTLLGWLTRLRRVLTCELGNLSGRFSSFLAPGETAILNSVTECHVSRCLQV
jgi:hypothetical protein